jgi:hypothetical protein
MPLSIFKTHSKILGVIPTTEQSLIYDLKTFVHKTKDSDKKHAYTDYLRVLLKYMPPRPLKNSDPHWMWDCQEIFSRGFHSDG